MILEDTLTVDGIRLHYLEAGADADGPPVLMLHGWPTSAQLWRHALPAIGQHRRAIAVDLPGFGTSDKPLDASYSNRFYNTLITGFLDEMGIDRVGLAVHDLGGPVGVHWAIQNRERVSDLTLLNTLLFPELSWAVIAFVAASRTPGIRRWLSSRHGIAWSMRLGVTDKTRITDAVARLYTDPFEGRAARKALLKTAHGLHPGCFRTIADGLSAFRDVPVSILYGEDDRILPNVAQTMRKAADILPHATVTSLPGCGHFLQEDRPDEVAQDLARILAGHIGKTR